MLTEDLFVSFIISTLKPYILYFGKLDVSIIEILICKKGDQIYCDHLIGYKIIWENT